MRALTFGEALIDEFPDRRVVAGAPLHVAAHLVALGWEAFLVTRVGRDNDGEWLFETLAEHGIAADLVETDDELPTGRATVEMEGTSHSFSLARPVAWDAIKGPAEAADHDALLFGTLPTREPGSRAALARLLEQSAAPLRVFDVNLRPGHIEPKGIELGLAAATVLKVNDEEFPAVADIAGIEPSTASYFEAAPHLLWLCVTRGPDGAELFHRDLGSWAVAGVSAQVVDTVGAGDAFIAGLIDGLARGREPSAVLDAAQEVAAATLGRRGGLPPPVGRS